MHDGRTDHADPSSRREDLLRLRRRAGSGGRQNGAVGSAGYACGGRVIDSRSRAASSCSSVSSPRST